MNDLPKRRLITLACVLSCSALAAPSYAAKAKPSAEEEATEPASVGVLLGRFQVRELRAAEGAKIRLAFAVYSEVPEDQAEATRALLESHKSRIRDAVLTAIRTCEQEEFHDPSLVRFRRRVQLRLWRMVPRLACDRLLVGEYEFRIE